jgi:carbamoyltransferase
MRVVGIHDGHNASACLLEDGRIVAAIQEERLRRVKNWAGFPSRALEFVLRKAGLRMDQIDVYAFSGVEMPDQMTLEERLAFYQRDCQPPPPKGGLIRRTARATGVAAAVRPFRTKGSGARQVRTEAAKQTGVPAERVAFIEHHACHAAAAYYGWGRYDSDLLVLTNDGEGDGLCATVNVGRHGRLERLASVPAADSIASLYAVTTFLLGMTPLEHEYKLMGMAPYASPRASGLVADKFRRLIEAGDGLGWRRTDGCPPTLHTYHFLRDLLERDRFDAVCGGLQVFLEERLVEWVRRALRQTGLRRVALSGGVFMNVKLNKRILELDEVEELFVFPSCGDETNCIGAAYYVQAERDHRAIEPLGPIYLGGEWTPAEIAAEVQRFSFATPVNIAEHGDLPCRIAGLLAEGHVVARFAGRSEFGARALGNRSLLADPSRRDVVKTINSMIKSRDFWMPFATTLTAEQAPSCLVNPKNAASPYMILAFDTTERVRDFIAGVHPQDLTVRPQVLDRSWNPPFHDLICEFQRRTGRAAAVLNTSFNLHGHPLVESPRDALDVFSRSGLTHLAIGNLLLEKK